MAAVTPKIALIIGAAAALLFGVGLTVAPAQMLAGFGLGAPAAAMVLSRDVGVTLIGIGLLNWLLRGAEGAVLSGLLIGNLFIQVAELVVNGLEIAAGQLPPAAGGGLVIHLVLGALFTWALLLSRRVSSPAS